MNNHLRTPRNITHIVKAILSAYLFCLCVACGNGPDPQSKTIADIIHTTDSPGTQEAVYTDDSTDDIQFVPRNITSASIGAVKAVPGKEFDLTAALKALFPGNYYRYHKYGDSFGKEELVSWRCKDCPTAAFKGWDGDDNEIFPLGEGNMTLCTDTLQYIGDDGSRNVLVAFSTMPVQPLEFMHTGRFSCSIMGLALFRAGNDKWELKYFSPALGCYGAFQSMPDIHLLRLGPNNYGCYLFNTNGGAGGPFYSDLYAFGIVNGKFKKIMEETGVQRFDAGGSEYRAALAGGNTPDAIKMTITGMYSKNLFENDTTSNLPKELMAYIAAKDSLNFIITREYWFTNGSYTLSTTKTETK